jgi:DNA-binding transcriptional ArsR family regulator
MQTTIDKSGSFVASQFAGAVGAPSTSGGRPDRPALTISHQTGAGAHFVAELLAEMLQQTQGKGIQPWTVFDRALVETALEEHHLPRQLAKKMPEDGRSYLDDVLDDLFGLRPPSWVLVPQVAETMLHLAEAGHVILIGRGATIVTERLRNVFHVRLVASLATRVRRTQLSRHLTAEEARRLIEKEDRGRQRYVRANFHARLDDTLLYHVVLNTDQLALDDVAAVIAEAALKFFHRAGKRRN